MPYHWRKFGEVRRLGQVPWQDCSPVEKLLIPSSLWRSAVALEVAHESYVDLGSDRVLQVDTNSRPKPGLRLG